MCIRSWYWSREMHTSITKRGRYLLLFLFFGLLAHWCLSYFEFLQKLTLRKDSSTKESLLEERSWIRKGKAVNNGDVIKSTAIVRDSRLLSPSSSGKWYKTHIFIIILHKEGGKRDVALIAHLLRPSPWALHPLQYFRTAPWMNRDSFY